MQFITASDGTVLCLGAAFLAASGCCWVKYFASSSTLGLIRDAPSACVSDLRSLIDDSGDSRGRLVVVRGQVQAKPGVSGWLGVVSKSGELAVAVQRTETVLYSIEERILPVGKQITAVGICVNKDGALEIKPCMQLPYFLSDKTKEEIEMDLTFNTKILFWVSAVLGAVSLSFLGYAIIRNWQGRKIEGRKSENEESSMEDSENVPDGELCIICLARRRVHAFVPCGHRICCHSCTVHLMESRLPKCYLCQQQIISYMRIYNS